MRFVLTILAVFVMGAFSASAQDTPPDETLPTLSYGHLPTIAFDVSYIDITSLYEAPFKDPNIEHRMPQPPEVVAKRWAADRLKAAGSNGWTLRFLITDASVIETKLKKKGGFTGFFTTEQSERYDATLNIALELRDQNRRLLAEVRVNGSKSQTVAENISLAEREKVWFDMVEAMMFAANKELEAQITLHMSQYLR